VISLFYLSKILCFFTFFVFKIYISFYRIFLLSICVYCLLFIDFNGLFFCFLFVVLFFSSCFFVFVPGSFLCFSGVPVACSGLVFRSCEACYGTGCGPFPWLFGLHVLSSRVSFPVFPERKGVAGFRGQARRGCRGFQEVCNVFLRFCSAIGKIGFEGKTFGSCSNYQSLRTCPAS
jgi:hypothetical protein